MQIKLNGETCEISSDQEPPTVADLIQQHGFGSRRLAVEVNETLVPRSEHAERRLQEGDRVEVVQAIGGG
ncbi:sulfur carrier protein ThiS [Thioalkalivibrio sp. ALE11]|uniref:sulfur carrier protein ThiS n=1 Tax=Thioalkalivibrio sp. ALE11 TaxID=1265494 RepID=UPI000372442A|nr:sulfur carrier protein ThiS [Thioalkalivibrio sp. ALE11]